MSNRPKFCRHCGTELSSDVRFCEMCGQPVFSDSELSQPQPETSSPIPVAEVDEVAALNEVLTEAVPSHPDIPDKQEIVTEPEEPLPNQVEPQAKVESQPHPDNKVVDHPQLKRLQPKVEAQPARRSQRKYWTIGIIVMLGGLVLIGSLFGATQMVQQSRVRASATAASAAATAETQATASAYADLLNSLTAGYETVLGPREGSLTHNANDDRIAHETDSKIWLRDFAVGANFFNPYSNSTGSWDYGFLFRSKVDQNFRLIIKADKTWELNLFSHNDFQTIKSGDIPYLNVNKGESNLIILVCKKEKGWLLVNSQLTAQFSLSKLTDWGEVAIATGFYKKDRIIGEKTNYKNFTILSNQQAKSIVSADNVEILAGQYKVQDFTVEPDMKEVILEGSFEASGGFDNDIEFFVLNEQDYDRWAAGKSISQPLYKTGLTKSDAITLSIGKSGKYYLVFSNKQASLLPRYVTAHFWYGWED